MNTRTFHAPIALGWAQFSVSAIIIPAFVLLIAAKGGPANGLLFSKQLCFYFFEIAFFACLGVFREGFRIPYQTPAFSLLEFLWVQPLSRPLLFLKRNTLYTLSILLPPAALWLFASREHATQAMMTFATALAVLALVQGLYFLFWQSMGTGVLFWIALFSPTLAPRLFFLPEPLAERFFIFCATRPGLLFLALGILLVGIQWACCRRFISSEVI